ncbi:MAG TPA: zf-HC2 domain-containing protein [Thermoanaerobaculia bacterium]|nr:zf-HC2 domain-containing protein [Thermoanaerobaculia bacterium]
MTCTGDGAERELQITAYLDGELDLTSALDLERHLAACPHCAAALGAQRAMQEAIGAADLRFRPTAQQARRLRGALGAPAAAGRAGQAGQAAWWRQPQLRALAALLLAAVGVLAGWTAGRRWPAPAVRGAPAAQPAVPAMVELPELPELPAIGEQVLASHVRGQLSGRPEDVASTDRHTVKPWFAGRLDYSPPVVDLAAQGFPLRGGRLDYVGGRPVATLIYQAGNHLVSVLVWPAGPETAAERAPAPGGAVTASSRRGFQLRHWSQAGMTWWAVSEVAADRLDELVRRLRAELPPAS